jgi:uncharacterized membrane protein YkoI
MTHRFTLPTLTALAALAGVGLVAGPVAATSEPAAPDSDFARAVDTALAETGEGVVTSYEAERTGYDVEVRLADGSDVDVDLDADFAVVRVRPDTERVDDAEPITQSTDLDAAYDAVVAEVAGGTVVSIELDDDGGYDADFTLDDGSEVEVHLDDAFDVVRTERDDD